MQKLDESTEERAIQKLIEEINDLDRWRDRVGRRILTLFAFGFAVAMALLMWVASSNSPRVFPRHPLQASPAVSGTRP